MPNVYRNGRKTCGTLFVNQTPSAYRQSAWQDMTAYPHSTLYSEDTLNCPRL